MEKVQPICVVCRQQFLKEGLVQVDQLFDHFTHFFCCSMDVNEIRYIGKFGEIVMDNKKYKKMYLVE